MTLIRYGQRGTRYAPPRVAMTVIAKQADPTSKSANDTVGCFKYTTRRGRKIAQCEILVAPESIVYQSPDPSQNELKSPRVWAWIMPQPTGDYAARVSKAKKKRYSIGGLLVVKKRRDLCYEVLRKRGHDPERHRRQAVRTHDDYVLVPRPRVVAPLLPRALPGNPLVEMMANMGLH